ncbi:MAG TPA: hypothetical protein VLQ67_11085 [Arachnia sp.]|nr:hypothetical protein [Arachnia sp.]
MGAVLFLLPILATVALYLPSGLLMPARILTVVAAGLAAWELASTRTLSSPRVVAGVGAVSAVFLILGVVAMLRFPDTTSVTSAVHHGFIALTCLTMAVLTTQRRRVLASVWGWLASAVLAGVVGFWEVITAEHLPGNAPAQEYADTLPGWNDISSFFDNPNLYAYHLVVTLLVLPVMWSTAGRRTRWLVLPLGAALSYLLIRTDGRMALMTLAVGTGLWCLRYRWSQLLALAVVALTGLTMAINVPPGRYVLDFIKLALDNIQWRGTSTWVRAEMARSGWWMAEQSNHLGVGPGGYPVWAFDPANPHTYEQLNNAHWGMVEVLAEYGPFALVVLLGALGIGTVMALRTAALPSLAGDRHRADRTIMIAGAITAVTVPLLSMAHSTWLRQPLTAVHLGLVVSLLAYAGLRTWRQPVPSDDSATAQADAVESGGPDAG